MNKLEIVKTKMTLLSWILVKTCFSLSVRVLLYTKCSRLGRYVFELNHFSNLCLLSWLMITLVNMKCQAKGVYLGVFIFFDLKHAYKITLFNR